MIVDGESHVFLKVFQTLRYEMFYPQRQFQLVDLFLVSEVGEDAGPTSVLQRLEVSLQDPERHLCFSCSAADYREQRFFYVLKTGESHAQGHTVLVVGESPRDPVEVEADGCGDVLSECLNVLFVSATVPQEAFMTEAPAVFVLAQHVHEGVHVEPGLLGADTEHHAGPEYSLRDVDLPVVSAAIEDPGAPDSGSSVAPVRMEVSNPLLGAVEPDLVGLVGLVPGPVVLAPGTQGVGSRGLDSRALHPLED